MGIRAPSGQQAAAVVLIQWQWHHLASDYAYKMIAATYTPDGIVISTYDRDLYYLPDSEEGRMVKSYIQGHDHILTFWDRYALVYHQLNDYSYIPSIHWILQDVMSRWENEIPAIQDFMPYIKKAIVDQGIEIVGVVAGYSKGDSGMIEPYVYQILGQDIRRINRTSSGEVTYNTVFIEKDTVIGRLLREVKIENGDNLESLPPIQIRGDLYSIKKALDLNRFLLNTKASIEQINTSEQPNYNIESIVITYKSIEII